MWTGATTSLPPGPEQSAERQLAEFTRDPFGFVDTLADRYGRLFTARLGSLGAERHVGVEHTGDWVFLTTPEQIRIMYGADDGTVSGALANSVFFATADGSVSYIDGGAHRRRRALVQPAFTGKRDYTAVISSVVDRHLAQWPCDDRFALFPRLQRMTADIIVEVVCGGMPLAQREQLLELLVRLENAAVSPEEALSAETAVRELVADHVRDRRDTSLERDDVLGTLLAHAADRDSGLGPDVVPAEVFGLLFTGFSTTANTLAWAFLHILDDEAVHREVRNELGDRLGSSPVGRRTFADMRYLEAVIDETLRLHPVSAINGVRLVKKPLDIDGHRIPTGAILVHCAHVLQRDPNLYPRPATFDPRRFLDTAPEPYVWAPFGGGARTCPGRGYAKEEMKTILALVLSTVDIEAVGGIPPARQQGIFMAPSDGAPCVVRKRGHDRGLAVGGPSRTA